MRGRMWIAIGAVGIIAVAVVVVVLVQGNGPSSCQVEADRVAAAMANPLGPMPSLSNLPAKDAQTVRTFRNAFKQAYNQLPPASQSPKRREALVRWNTFIIPQMKKSTREEHGC